MKRSRALILGCLTLIVAGGALLVSAAHTKGIFAAHAFQRAVVPGMTQKEVVGRIEGDFKLYDLPGDRETLLRDIRSYNKPASLDLADVGSVITVRTRPSVDYLGVILFTKEGRVLRALVLNT